MVSTAIWDAVRALNDKIKSAAPLATAEELAYLANAMEKIGGHVSLVDLSDHVDALRKSLTNASSEGYFQLTNAIEGAKEQLRIDLSTLVDDNVKALHTEKDDSISAITIDKLKALDNINTVTQQNLAGVSKAVTDLLAVIKQASEASEILSESTGISDHDLYFFANL